MADQNGTKPRDPDFYAGFTRFEIECEVGMHTPTTAQGPPAHVLRD